MSKMVLLKCDIGSRAATVLCPECGRISRQILLLPYYHDVEARLIRPHTCPVCNTIFECCTPNQAGNWLAAFERYNRNADAYNQSIKIDYASKRDALVHSMTSVLSSAAQVAPEKTAEKKFFYCSIDIKGVNFPLFYPAQDGYEGSGCGGRPDRSGTGRSAGRLRFWSGVHFPVRLVPKCFCTHRTPWRKMI